MTLFDTDDLKKVSIYMRGGHPMNGQPYHEGFLQYGSHKKPVTGAIPGTTQENILTGAIAAVQSLKCPCEITMHTATQIGTLNKKGKPRGAHKALKQQLLDAASEKDCVIIFDSTSEPLALKRLIRLETRPHRKPVSIADAQKHTEADFLTTHYRWRGPTGIEEWIPNDVDMAGRETEKASF